MSIYDLKINGNQIVKMCELYQFPDRVTVVIAIEGGLIEASQFDDNGGDPDGDRWLMPCGDELTRFPLRLERLGVKRVIGWEVEPYTGDANYAELCGLSSRSTAYTTSIETAEAIARDEIGVASTRKSFSEEATRNE